MVENNTVRVYCFWAVRANHVSSCSAPRTRSSVPRTITEIGLFSTKRANTVPSMVASCRKSVSKAWIVTKGERKGHLNRAAPHSVLRQEVHLFVPTVASQRLQRLDNLGMQHSAPFLE